MKAFAVFAIEYLLAFGCAAFAFRQGDRPERLGAILLVIDLIGGATINLLRLDSPTLYLIEDGVFAVGLLPLAVIYVSYWIGAATLLAAALFSLEALYLVNDWTLDNTYMRINNGLWLALPLTFLISGICNWLRRRRDAASISAALPPSAVLG
jgi:hypothetical protein